MNSSDIVEIVEVDRGTILAEAGTPAGTLIVVGDVEVQARVLFVSRARVQGLTAGALGRDGSNAIAQRFMEDADADALIVKGSTRVTGRNPGRPPKQFRFDRRRTALPKR